MSESAQYRLVIADDHPLFRGALREAVHGLFERVDIAEAGSFDEVTKLLEGGSDVDLIMLDLTMPGVRGFSGLMYLRAQYPSVPVVVVSANDDPAVIRRCMDFGSAGFVPKTLGIDVIRSAIKRASEIDWHPLQIVVNVSSSVGAVMMPAGFENSQGILSANYAKDAGDPQWADDPGMKKFIDFLAQYYPEGNKLDAATVFGYGAAQTLVEVLKQCGDDLTRDNVMKQAASLKDFQPDTLLPGIKINTSASDYAPIKELQMMRFKGEKWDLFGDIMNGELTH